jgi:hypothetical protein
MNLHKSTTFRKNVVIGAKKRYIKTLILTARCAFILKTKFAFSRGRVVFILTIRLFHATFFFLTMVMLFKEMIGVPSMSLPRQILLDRRLR